MVHFFKYKTFLQNMKKIIKTQIKKIKWQEEIYAFVKLIRKFRINQEYVSASFSDRQW